METNYNLKQEENYLPKMKKRIYLQSLFKEDR